MRKNEFYGLIRLLLIVFISCQSLYAQEVSAVKSGGDTTLTEQVLQPEFVSFKLENGLRVIVLEDQKQENINVRLLIDRPLLAEKVYAGTGALTEKLLLGRTFYLDQREIEQKPNPIEGNIQVTDRTITGCAPNQNTAYLLKAIADLVIKPAFLEEDFISLQKEYLAATIAQEKDPEVLAEQFSRMLIFGESHPYGETATPESIANVTAQACRNFHVRYLRPTVAHLAIVGNIKPEKARELVETYFGKWQATGPLFAEFYNSAPLPESTRINIVDLPNQEDVAVDMGYSFRLRPATDEALQAQLLEVLLEDQLSTKSWYQAKIEVGLVADPHLGRFRVKMVLPKAVVATAVQDIFTVMYELREEPIDEQKLSAAKSKLAMLFAEQHQKPEQKAKEAINVSRFKLSKTYYDDRIISVANISAQALLETAQQYLVPGRTQVVVVADKAIAPSLEQLVKDGELHFYTPDGEEIQRISQEIRWEDISAQEVISKYVRAIGGAERLENIQDMTTVVETVIQDQIMTTTEMKKEGEKLWSLTKIGGVLVNKTILNEDKASVLNAKKKEEINDDQLVFLREQAYIFPETRYDALGFKLELAGGTVINGVTAHGVEIRMPSGRRITDYFDARTGLRIRSVDVVGGAPVVSDFMDYHSFDGIKYPRQVIVSGASVEPLIFELKSIVFNQGISDEQFVTEN